VEEASPAANAGLIVGDIVTGFEGKPIGGHEDLLSRLRSASAGQTVELETLRAGKLQMVKIALGEQRRREASDRGHRR
jgi:putative serine protease PepD